MVTGTGTVEMGLTVEYIFLAYARVFCICVIVIKISTSTATAATDDLQRREKEPGHVMCVRRTITIPILYYIITICIGYVLQCCVCVCVCVCANNVGLCRPNLKFYLRFFTDSTNRKLGR